jgi:hypothetical protein
MLSLLCIIRSMFFRSNTVCVVLSGEREREREREPLLGFCASLHSHVIYFTHLIYIRWAFVYMFIRDFFSSQETGLRCVYCVHVL